MDTRDLSTALDPASEAVLQAQREMLTRLVAELLASQRAALTALQSEMERTNEELSHRLTSWRQRMIAVIHLNTALLVPWLALLAVLAVATLVLGAKAGSAWNDYRVAADAAQRIHAQGAITLVKDGRLYVRINPDSVAQGRRGSWYAEPVNVEFLRDGEDPEP
jgi:hypothetical protein